MRTITVVSGLLCALFATPPLQAQETPELSAPQEEHLWLHKFIGEWESESVGPMGPGQPTMKCKGTMSSRAIGGFWIVSEVNGDMLGTQVTAIQTIGYNAEKKKYVGTWIDSVMNHMWTYEGSVDETGKILTLDAEGPDFEVAGKTRKYRDAYEFKSADHIASTSSMLGDDGKWVVFMTGDVRRSNTRGVTGAK